jgi:CelD/BcsL family acetyltransferase involved in cellulose biosynthesis
VSKSTPTKSLGCLIESEPRPVRIGPPASSKVSTRMAATMKVTVVRPAELGISEEKIWREFQSSSPMGSHPYFSLTYVRAACRADESGRVAVAENDGAIRAFIPYTKGGDGIATTLGGGFTGLDGLVSSNDPMDLRSVVRGAGLRGWRFSHAPDEQRPLEPYRYRGSYHKDTNHFVDLRNGYDGYIRGLTAGAKKRISRTATYRRAIQRELGEVSFEWNSSDPSHLPLLLDWKTHQFESVRQWLSSPSARTLVRDLADSDNEDCSGVTSVLSAGTKPVSIVFSLRCGHIIAPWILAYDPEYSRFSPGTIEWLVLFEEAAARRVDMVDFGYGDDRYKERFGNATYSVSGGGVWASRLGSAARSLYRRARYGD